MKPSRPSDERTEVLRLTVPHAAWVIFQQRAMLAREKHPKAGIPNGDRGTRAMLTAWLEAKLRGQI